MDKKYGLQLRVNPLQPKKPVSKPPIPNPLAFAGSDDEDGVERDISRQAYKKKSLKDIDEQHKKALEEDPSVFDYDGVYDDMKQKAARPVHNDRQERKPKYIQQLIEKAKLREKEHEIIYERKIAKERSKDDHLYADKDKFVTAAYKRKLAEQAKWEQEESIRKMLEEKDDVTKKSDLTDFYFNLAKNVAFGGPTDAELRNAEKQKEAQTKSKQESSSSMKTQSERPKSMEREESRTPVPHREETKQTDAMPSSDALPQETATSEPQVSNKPMQNHHKKTQDDLAAAKERFLARKKAKQ